MKICWLAAFFSTATLAASCPGNFSAELDAQWNQYRLHSNTKALAAILDEKFILTHSDGRVEDKASYVTDLSTGNRVNKQIDNFDVEVRCFDQTALVTGRTLQVGVSGGKEWRGEFRFTRVWLFRDKQWLLQASHSSRITEKPL